MAENQGLKYGQRTRRSEKRVTGANVVEHDFPTRKKINATGTQIKKRGSKQKSWEEM